MIAVVAQIPTAATAACGSDNLYLKQQWVLVSWKVETKFSLCQHKNHTHCIPVRIVVCFFFFHPVCWPATFQGLTVQYFWTPAFMASWTTRTTAAKQNWCLWSQFYFIYDVAIHKQAQNIDSVVKIIQRFLGFGLLNSSFTHPSTWSINTHSQGSTY